MKFVTDIFAKAGLIVDGSVTLNTTPNANVDTDKFLVQDGAVVKYRTGAEVLSDIGAQGAITLTVIGNSGPSTLIGNGLNIPTYTLSGLGGVPLTRNLTINGTTYNLSADRSWSVGTVTSVDMTVPTGLSISGNPITSAGTLALTYASGYAIPTTASQLNWDSAYNNMVTAISYNTSTGDITLTQQDLGTLSTTITLAPFTTSNLAEGSNLYFTNARARTAISLTTSTNSGPSTYNSLTGVLNVPEYTLSGLGGVPSSRTLTINGTTYDLTANRTWSVGTVTSVDFAVPVGFSIFGNPITSSGTLTLTFASGYSLPTTASQINWDAAYNNMVNAISYNTSSGVITLTQQDLGTLTTTVTLQPFTTTNLAEGTNLYYTDARARQSISLTTTGSSGSSTYSNVTGILNIPTYTLSGLGGVPSTRQLTINGTSFDLSADRTWAVGTVTSVDMSVPTGFTIAGNPITSNGTLALGFATGYSLPTNTNQGNWTTAYNRSITGFSYNTSSGVLTITKQDTTTLTATVTLQPFTTTNLTEGTNLYYTDARVRLALSAGTGISYNNLTGVITNSAPDQTVVLTGAGTTVVTGTYPNFTITSNDSFIGTVTSVAALTLGTSGTDLSSTVANSTTTPVITLNVPTASATNRGALSSADWTTFNSKVGGSGTTNYVSKFTASGTIGNSQIFDNGTSVGIGTTSPAYKLDVSGDIRSSTGTYLTSATAGTTQGFDFNGLGLVTFGVNTSGNALVVNDIDGAKFAFSTGGFGTTFYKHRSTDNRYYKTFVIKGSSSASYGTGFDFYVGTSIAANISSNGNLLLGTTTDAGYKLDVNGTARVSGSELRLDNGTTGTLNIYSATPVINFFSLGGYTIGRSGTTMTWNSGGSINLQIGGNGGYQIDGANGHVFRSAITGGAALARLDTGGSLSIGNGSTAANASSILDLTSTTKGFLPPRMTNAQMIAITTPAAGLVVYDNTLNDIVYYNGTAWTILQDAISLTTTGSSGAATLTGTTLNIPNYTLSGLGGVPTTRTLTINGTAFDLSADRSWSVGTVTSVGVSVPTGFSVASSPVTSSGTIAISFTAGYSLPTNASQTNWDTAYTNRITSLTTTGTSGAATLVSNVLNIPQYQAQGNYITALTGEATASGPGSVAITLTNSAVIGKVLTGLSVTSGSIASTDSILSAFGKIQGQINALSGGLQFQGTWNANTNTPTITSGVGVTGKFYIVNVAGNTTIDGNTGWQVGDWILFDGTVWQKVDNTDAVSSVNGQTGAVVLTTTNISEGTNLYYTDSRARQAISLTTTGSSGAATYSNVTGILNVPQYTLTGLGGVPTTRTLTINGTALDLSTDRSWSVGTVTSIATTGPITGGTITGSGTIGITQANTTTNGFLSSTDWNTFNNKQNAITLTTTGSSGASTLVGATLNIPNYTISGLGGVPTTRTITINGTAQDLSVDRTWSVGTVTSVAALTIGTTGTDITSSVATGTTTPVITLNVPTASATNRGALSSADWSTFNGKQNAITLTTSGSSGASTFIGSTLNVPNYTLAGLGGQPLATNLTSLSGLTFVSTSFVKMTASGTFALDTNVYYLASNPNGYTSNTGTVTSVAALTLGTTGTDLSSSVATGTTTPVITLNVPTASATNRGALSSADWTTFNSKEPAIAAGTTSQYWRGDKSWQTLNTTAVTEGTNLYFTNSRARTAISLTTTGTSGAATYDNTTGVLNIPQYQSVLTNPVTGTGTTSYVARWTSSSALGIGVLFDNGTNVLVGSTTDSTLAKFQVTGAIQQTSVTSSMLKVNSSGVLVAAIAGTDYLTSTSTDFTFNASLTLSTTWQDTGVSATNLTTSGVYLVTCAANDTAVGGGQSTETYVGIMYWFAGSTNSTNFSEIALHHSGIADGDRFIYLRTRTDLTSSTGRIYLQIKGNGTNSGASTYTFTFKRLM